MIGGSIDGVELHLVALGGYRRERHRTIHERQFEVPSPVWTYCHLRLRFVAFATRGTAGCSAETFSSNNQPLVDLASRLFRPCQVFN